MDEFIKGRDICQSFYQNIIAQTLSTTRHDAVLIGEGSDVLGYDSPISADHDWGIRLTIFIESEQDITIVREQMLNTLPNNYMGIAVRKDEEVSNIVVTTVSTWLSENLGITDVKCLSTSEWLSFPQQHLLQFTRGTQFGGTLGRYQKAKDILSWYPVDIWKWLMASQWYLIWCVERLIPRTYESGDILGSQMAVHKLLRYIIQMCFLQNQIYQPYDKWLGTSFKEVQSQHNLEKLFFEVISSTDINKQIDTLHTMLLKLGECHNTLALTTFVSPRITPYEVGVNNAVRPYMIINSADYKNACVESIQDKSLKNLVFVGGIDQLAVTSDAMINFTDWKLTIKNGYEQKLLPNK